MVIREEAIVTKKKILESLDQLMDTDGDLLAELAKLYYPVDDNLELQGETRFLPDTDEIELIY